MVELMIRRMPSNIRIRRQRRWRQRCGVYIPRVISWGVSSNPVIARVAVSHGTGTMGAMNPKSSSFCSLSSREGVEP